MFFDLAHGLIGGLGGELLSGGHLGCGGILSSGVFSSDGAVQEGFFQGILCSLCGSFVLSRESFAFGSNVGEELLGVAAVFAWGLGVGLLLDGD